MLTFSTREVNRRSTVQGSGLLNTLINKLPFELHIPGYQYCGPGTRLQKRLERGDPGINLLDRACKEHDIAYSKSTDTHTRNEADLRLAEKAWERVKASDSKAGEKVNAYLVTNLMKAKAKFGLGMNKMTNKVRKQGKKKKKKKKNQTGTRQNVLRQMMTKSKSLISRKKPKTVKNAIQLALAESKKKCN